jgi:uncharacterized membrane protein YdjX (TVP38/TMEM64 family)
MTLLAMTAALPFFKRHWQKMLALLFWLALVLAFVLYSGQNNLTPLAATRQLMTALGKMPVHVRGLIFTVVYTLRPLIFFPASILTLAIGALCGPLWGIIYAVIGSNLSATLAYFVGRLLGQDVVQGASQNALQRYLQRMRQNSFETIFVMRLIFLPYDLVNYAAGFLKINYGAFILATILGSLPGTISFVLFGASSGLDGGAPKFDWRILAISVGIFVGSLLVSRLVKRREASNVEA